MISKIFDKMRSMIDLKKRRLLTKFLIRKFKNESNKDIKKLSDSLKFIIDSDKWNQEELKAFDKINEIRRQYETSTESVLIKDFGAGSPTSSRTKEQIDHGVDSVKMISELNGIASTTEIWGKLIFKLIRDFKPKNCLELGTCLGISASYQISALKLNNQGKLNTIEGAKSLAEIADKCLGSFEYQYYSVHTGKFKDILPNILSHDQPLDFVFVDGHHNKEATMEYFELLYPFLATKSILIFDDIDWSDEMRAVWKDLYEDSRMKVSFDLSKWGICLINKEDNSIVVNYHKLTL